MTQINSLNPVRMMRVQDWLNVAELFQIPIQGVSPSALKCASAIDLMERYESEVLKPLERKHFVNLVEAPKEKDYLSEEGWDNEGVKKVIDAYQSDLIFEGFRYSDEVEGINAVINDKEATAVAFQSDGQVWLEIRLTPVLFEGLTIFDFIYHISKYNETAATKIELKFTEQFCKKIIQ